MPSPVNMALHLVILLQLLQLLKNRGLGVDLLKLSVLQLLSTSQAHLKVLDGSDLLLKTANLLGIGVLGGIGGGGTVVGGLLLRSLVSVAMAVSVSAVSVAAAAALVVSGLASVVAVAAALGAAALAARTSTAITGRRSQAGSAVRFALGPAISLVVLLVTLLLVL